MSDKSSAERLAHAVASLGCTEVIRATFAENVVTVLFRVTTRYPGTDGNPGKPDERPLLKCLERLVLHDPEGRGTLISHVCSRLLPKEVDGQLQMVKGWNITINSRGNMDADLATAVRLLRGEPSQSSGKKTTELEEFPLVGVGPSRKSPKDRKGKGAWTVGGSGGDNFKP
jgi:hypothetical protein